ncbi:hypothetical protein ACWIEX_06020 [Bosea sp. NPDC055353]
MAGASFTFLDRPTKLKEIQMDAYIKELLKRGTSDEQIIEHLFFSYAGRLINREGARQYLADNRTRILAQG